MANYDIIGNIAILKFPDETKKEAKKKLADEFLREHGSVKTVLEKADKVHGRLRTIDTNFLAGEKNLVADYRESNCRFKLNVETCYFSPRLANERIEVAKIASRMKKPRVLVMFAGVGPFSIIIATHAKPSKVISVELGKECLKYAQQNVYLNAVNDVVEVVPGDVKKTVPKIIQKEGLFDLIVMPRPNLKETFLKEGLSAARKGSIIVYYGFSPESKKQEMIKDLENEAKKLKRKIKITKVLEAGDIAPYEHRYRIEIIVEK